MRNLYVISAVTGVVLAIASVVLGLFGVLLVFAGPPTAAVLIAGPALDRRLARHYLATFIPQTLLVFLFANLGGEVEEPIASGPELAALYFGMSAFSALLAVLAIFGGTRIKRWWDARQMRAAAPPVRELGPGGGKRKKKDRKASR